MIKKVILAFLVQVTRFMISQQIHAYVGIQLLFGMELNAFHATYQAISI